MYARHFGPHHITLESARNLGHISLDLDNVLQSSMQQRFK
jgi:hypothetical protein